jgi:hypothetical protein
MVDIGSAIHLPANWQYGVTWTCAIVAFIISTLHIVSHFRTYTCPPQQRLIVRISAVIPIYAISSALSFSFPDHVLYFAAIRDIAEAFVIYSFLTLLYDYLGGEGAIINAINGMPIRGSWMTWTCCLSGIPFSIKVLRFCKRATLQFCFVRPLVSIMEVIMFEAGYYEQELAFSLHSSPLFVTITYNLSISLALYGLALFYTCTKKILEPQRPLMKFISVKGIILVCYWQSLFISIYGSTDKAKNDGFIPGAVQALLTSIETVPAAVLVAAAFPVAPYRNESVDASPLDPAGFKQISVSMRDTVNPSDILQDVVHNFSSRYRGYAQYHNVQLASSNLPEMDSRLIDDSDEESPI